MTPDETWKEYMERMERTYSHLPNYAGNLPLDEEDEVDEEEQV